MQVVLSERNVWEFVIVCQIDRISIKNSTGSFTGRIAVRKRISKTRRTSTAPLKVQQNYVTFNQSILHLAASHILRNVQNNWRIRKFRGYYQFISWIGNIGSRIHFDEMDKIVSNSISDFSTLILVKISKKFLHVQLFTNCLF